MEKTFINLRYIARVKRLNMANYKGLNRNEEVAVATFDNGEGVEARLYIQDDKQEKQQKISPLNNMVRNEVVKRFAFLVKHEPEEKLEALINVAKETVKEELINICYNL